MEMIFQQKILTRFWQIWRGTRVFNFLLQKNLLRETLHVRKLLCLETQMEKCIGERKREKWKREREK